MSVLLLIRHALTDTAGKRLTGRTRGVHLTEAGREQARELAARLAAVPLAALYASPLERCVETAEPLAAAKGLEIRRAEALIEVDYGEWTGRPLGQVGRTKLWRSLRHTPSAVRFPGGETLVEVQDRAVREATRILAAHPNGIVGLVSHGDVVRLLLAHFAGVHVDLFQRLVVHPASVSAVAADGGALHVLRVNDTGTLSDLAPRRQAQRRRKMGRGKVGG